jgi:hypothetical protein
VAGIGGGGAGKESPSVRLTGIEAIVSTKKAQAIFIFCANGDWRMATK